MRSRGAAPCSPQKAVIWRWMSPRINTHQAVFCCVVQAPPPHMPRPSLTGSCAWSARASAPGCCTRSGPACAAAPRRRAARCREAGRVGGSGRWALTGELPHMRIVCCMHADLGRCLPTHGLPAAGPAAAGIPARPPPTFRKLAPPAHLCLSTMASAAAASWLPAYSSAKSTPICFSASGEVTSSILQHSTRDDSSHSSHSRQGSFVAALHLPLAAPLWPQTQPCQTSPARTSWRG